MKSIRISAVAAAVFIAASTFAAVEEPVMPADGFPGLSLRIDDEVAPAGSITQIKIGITEPKPISTGKGKTKTSGFAAIDGIALMNRGQNDAVGVAIVEGSEISFVISSPSGVFGTANDYPLIGIAGTVSPAAAPGTRFPMTLEGAIAFSGPGVVSYPFEIQQGTLTVGNSMTIGDVIPGSSFVPAGGVVTITGTGFTSDTRIQFHEVALAETRFISPTRIEVVLGQGADMHGMRIRARNDDSEATYFSYQRTVASAPSVRSWLNGVVPLFAPVSKTVSNIALPRQPGRRRAVVAVAASREDTAIALQNLGASSVAAEVALVDRNGNSYATATVDVAPNTWIVRELNEIFGFAGAPGGVRVTAGSPLQVMGILADPATGGLSPLPPN